TFSETAAFKDLVNQAFQIAGGAPLLEGEAPNEQGGGGSGGSGGQGGGETFTTGGMKTAATSPGEASGGGCTLSTRKHTSWDLVGMPLFVWLLRRRQGRRRE